MKTSLAIFFTCFLLLASAAPAAASEPGAVLFGGYWSAFIDHWEGVFQQQSGITVGVIVVGILALFIITRGKWLK